MNGNLSMNSNARPLYVYIAIYRNTEYRLKYSFYNIKKAVLQDPKAPYTLLFEPKHELYTLFYVNISVISRASCPVQYTHPSYSYIQYIVVSSARITMDRQYTPAELPVR